MIVTHYVISDNICVNIMVCVLCTCNCASCGVVCLWVRKLDHLVCHIYFLDVSSVCLLIQKRIQIKTYVVLFMLRSTYMEVCMLLVTTYLYMKMTNKWNSLSILSWLQTEKMVKIVGPFRFVLTIKINLKIYCKLINSLTIDKENFIKIAFISHLQWFDLII